MKIIYAIVFSLNQLCPHIYRYYYHHGHNFCYFIHIQGLILGALIWFGSFVPDSAIDLWKMTIFYQISKIYAMASNMPWSQIHFASISLLFATVFPYQYTNNLHKLLNGFPDLFGRFIAITALFPISQYSRINLWRRRLEFSSLLEPLHSMFNNAPSVEISPKLLALPI